MHGPYLSALEINGLYIKRYINSSVYFTFTFHVMLCIIIFVQVDKMVEETLSETQCDSCFETATSGRSLNGVCVVSPAVVHCVDCVQNLCISCCSRLCKLQSTHDDVRCGFFTNITM